jgi:CheY-like chemotaxis protein
MMSASVGLRVAIIEDNDDIADTLAVWLEHIGHRVWVARSGPTGVELVRAQQPDVVVCDIGLPDMDGVAVCRAVRALSLERQPLMIAVTGWGRQDDLARTAEAGFDHHLVKPVAPEELQRMIEQHLGSRAQAAP